MLSRPRVVSQKAIPQEQIDDGSGYQVLIRQAVVHMHSEQQLIPRHTGAVGSTDDATMTFEVEEYLVLQKRLYMGKEDDWMLWGTLRGETKLEDWSETMNPDPNSRATETQAVYKQQ